jgi:hypothetical protein
MLTEADKYLTKIVKLTMSDQCQPYMAKFDCSSHKFENLSSAVKNFTTAVKIYDCSGRINCPWETNIDRIGQIFIEKINKLTV